MEEIHNESIIGCDTNSRVYCESYNALIPFLFEMNMISSNEVDSFDRSSLGLYIGKYAEQEINSSVVQLMRRIRGIIMPNYYCKWAPDQNAIVRTKNKTIFLNSFKNTIEKQLSTIPLGDAYYACMALIEEHHHEFEEYDWIRDDSFKDTWRQLGLFRNKVAHIGQIVTQKELNEGVTLFKKFLSFMPNIRQLKEDLSDIHIIDSDQANDQDLVIPNATYIQWRRLQELEAIPFVELSDNLKIELDDLYNNYNWETVIYTGENGKKGMKDAGGNIVVPPVYDGFAFVYNSSRGFRTSIPACRNGKMGLVKTDGSGQELTEFIYDVIEGISAGDGTYLEEGYSFKKDNKLCYGIMLDDGTEILPCVIDEFLPRFSLSLYYKRGELWGVWALVQDRKLCTMPIYEEIEPQMEFGIPQETLFVLNGGSGFVTTDCKFISSNEYYAMDEFVRPSCIADA